MTYHRIGDFCGLILCACLCLPIPLTAETMTFPGSHIGLTVSDQTGAMTSLSVSREIVADAAEGRDSILLTVGGAPSRFPNMLRPPGDSGLENAQTIGKNWHRVGQTISDTGEATELRVESREGNWSLVVSYRIPRQADRIERRFSIRYEGAGVAVLRGVAITLPTLRGGPEDLLEMPGSPIPPSVTLAELDGRILPLGGFGPGVVALRNLKVKTALLCWAYSETEVPHMEVQRDAGGLKVDYSVELEARMTHGEQVSWGRDFVSFLSGDWSESLASLQRWFDHNNVQTPYGRPRWTESALIYETQIGAAPFDRGSYEFNPYPTVQSLIDKLDYIHDLGFNTLQLMPHHPSPSYAVDDYYNPSRQYGEGFERLVEACHKRGMHIIVDWIVHGAIDKEVAQRTLDIVNSGPKEDLYRKCFLVNYVLNFSGAWLLSAPQVNSIRAQHPDWFMKQDNGNIASIYTWSFDLENPDLQNYMITALKFYVETLKVDGFRVDAPEWNAFPNRDPKLPYRASYSETGAIRLFDKARYEIHRLNSQIMLYTENSDPVFRRMFDVNYAYGELWLDRKS